MSGALGATDEFVQHRNEERGRTTWHWIQPLVSGPPLAPAPPIGVAATTTSVTLRWRPPTSQGSAPVESYLLQSDDGFGGAFVQAAPPVQASQASSFEATAQGLTTDLPYRFRVAARNSFGLGAFSDPPVTVSTLSASAGVPAQPLPPRLVFASSSAIGVRWQESALNGAALVAFECEMQAEGASSWTLLYTGLGLEANATALQPGKNYL